MPLLMFRLKVFRMNWPTLILTKNIRCQRNIYFFSPTVTCDFKESVKVIQDNFFLDLIELLLSATTENLSQTYGTRVLRFFNKLFQLGKCRQFEVNLCTICILL